MIEGGNYSERQAMAIRLLLVAFDGDADAAFAAVRRVQDSRRLVDPPLVANNSTATISGNRSVEQQVEKIPTTPVILSARNLVKEYKLGKQQLKVLNDVSFDIHEAEIIAITGSSGSGKSTLLQLLGGLDKPSSGEVLVNGTSIAKLSDGKLSVFRRQTIGFVFQFFYLQPFLKLRRNLEVPGMFARTKRSDRAARIEELANKVGLADRLNHYPKELSGGQMQRAAIARALLNNPKIILADEPTGNLDSQNGEQIIDLFESIRNDFGTTVVIVTHDEEVARRADRRIRVADGKLV